MNPIKPVLSDFQWLMLDECQNEIPQQVLNSKPLSQYYPPKNQPETFSAQAYPLAA